MATNKIDERPDTFLGTFQYGASFTYKEKSYQIIGHDVGMEEIECQAIPFDNEFMLTPVIQHYSKWFLVPIVSAFLCVLAIIEMLSDWLKKLRTHEADNT